jgi:signal-transduction protein with cAMP-binding, CBS, and nucleotidyltransferase domain
MNHRVKDLNRLQKKMEQERPQKFEYSRPEKVPKKISKKLYHIASLSNRSVRLIEAICKVPLFSSLSEKELSRLSKKAHLELFDQDSDIIQQGNLGRTLYIILYGKTQVITYDNQGREILVSFLTDNQFFGEISFLTGVPMMVSAKALEETLLCKLSLEPMWKVRLMIESTASAAYMI